MKANEAPEKIILSADRETGILYDEWVIRDLTDNIKIEYTRTDAFIKKALKYLDENFYFKNSRYRIECGVFDSKEEMLKDFKKYMKDWLWRHEKLGM